MPHSLEKLPRLIDVSRKAMNTAWQNIFLFAGARQPDRRDPVRDGQIGSHRRGHDAPAFLVLRDDELAAAAARRAYQRASRFGRLIAAIAAPASLGTGARGGRGSRYSRGIRVGGGTPANNCTRPALYAAAALYVLSGVYMLSPNETGVIERFGRKILPYARAGAALQAALAHRAADPHRRAAGARGGGRIPIEFHHARHRAGRLRMERAASLRPVPAQAGGVADAHRRSEHDRADRHRALQSVASRRFHFQAARRRRDHAHDRRIRAADAHDQDAARLAF